MMKSFLQILFFSLISFILAASEPTEICDNRIDDDGDGLIDCLDPDCDGYNECWDCLTEFYQVHSNRQMVVLDPRDGTYSTLAQITGADQINGAQFNVLDGHVYAPIVNNGVQSLGMLNRDGSVTDLQVSFPTNSIYYMGAIDAYGKMYLGRGGRNVEIVELNTGKITTTTSPIPFPGVADLAYDITRGLFYGIDGNSKLIVMDPTNEDNYFFSLSGAINNESGGFGAAWSSNDGSFFAYNNSSGKIYSINLIEKTSSQILSGTGNLSINDGFNCYDAPPPFESNCSNGIDDDGDGLIDCEDPDCGRDNFCLTEICFNGIDDDGDGFTDCDDTECYNIEGCTEICDNGIDDNNNGKIDEEDIQCSASSGIEGGLESNNRLSTVIVKRNFERVKTNIANKKINTVGNHFKPTKVKTPAKSDLSIRDFVPVNAIENTESYISSPIDLTSITNATEVFSTDVFRDERRLASILVLKTEERVYEHTKYICDRLTGARILNIGYQNIKNNTYIATELLQSNGSKEIAMAFSAYLDETNEWVIENHWNLDRYPNIDEYFNFQIWANSHEDLSVLAEGIMDRLNAYANIKTVNNSKAPQVFVSSGKLVNDVLKLNIVNKIGASKIMMSGGATASETSVIESVTEELKLSGDYEETVEIDFTEIFDMGVRFATSDADVSDDLFFADGAWGYSCDDNTQVISYDIESSNTNNETDAFKLRRDVEIDFDLSDELSVFRAINANFRSEDLSKYNALSFELSGASQVEVTLIKASIQDWEDQFRTTYFINNDKASISIPVTSFKNASGSKISLDDVQSVLFTFKNSDGEQTNRTVTIENLRFNNLGDINSFFNNEDPIKVFPNPAIESVNISWISEKSMAHKIQIMDARGQVVRTIAGFSNEGYNAIKVNRDNMLSGMYFFRIVFDDYSSMKDYFIFHK